jgi:hypothetical protein
VKSNVSLLRETREEATDTVLEIYSDIRKVMVGRRGDKE